MKGSFNELLETYIKTYDTANSPNSKYNFLSFFLKKKSKKKLNI